MKTLYYIVVLFLMTGLFSACASTKEGRSIRKDINGNWGLQSISTEGINGKFTTRVFTEADLNCFTGSTWVFNSNNSLGSYSLENNSGTCVVLKRNIRWSIYEAKDALPLFQFKRLDDKFKPMDDNNGFRLSITMPDANTIQLKSPISLEGMTGNIVYNFVKK